jgi:peptide-methionine (S)-S-oxide reductase
MTTSTTTETAILAGGCFWCLEAVYDGLEGVSEVQSGYIGGVVDNPSYEAVCSGRTGHAEAVKITFDPNVLSFNDLLDVFFVIHDPTTLNRQGADVGTQYRSEIFATSPAQRTAAEEKIAALTAAREFDAPIVTAISDAPPNGAGAPAVPFYPAEPYHDDYFANNPNQPYCQAVVGPKVAKFRKHFADRLKHPVTP